MFIHFIILPSKMGNRVHVFIFLAVTFTSWIQGSLAICKKTPDCNTTTGDEIEIHGAISGPDHYSHPGPIILTCNISGHIQSINWKRKGADGIIHVLGNQSRTNVSSYWISTAVIYLDILSKGFPFTFQCIPIGKCCTKKESKLKTVERRSNNYAYERCFKDILFILDVSASVNRDLVNVNGKLKPFLRRLIDDPRLDVSAKGSNIAIMTFSEEVTVLLQFHETYDKSLYHKVIDGLSGINSWSRTTSTYLALDKANKKIFEKRSPLNHRPDVGDVIVLFTDGVPTPSRYYYPNGNFRTTTLLAGLLKKKGVRIVLVAYNLSPSRFNSIQEISTPGEALETPLDDIAMIADRVVDGFCPQPLLVPSKPRNVTVVILSGHSMEISWLPPKVSEDNIDYYIISWRRNDTNGTFYEKNAHSSPFRIPNLDDFASYNIKIQAVNEVAISKAEYLNDVLYPEIPKITDASESGRGEKSETSKVAVAGGVMGSVLFLLLVLVAFLFLRKRIQNKKREEAVQEFHLLHQKNRMLSATSSLPVPDPLNGICEWETEEISYVVLLKDWEISPSQLKIQDRSLGAGQFGIVKQGFYTPEKGDPETVAVKMLKENARESDHSDLLAELEILKKINKKPHTNVIRFIGGCSMEGKLLVVTEFCAGGDLRNFLRKSRVGCNSKESAANYLNVTSTLNTHQLLKLATEVANGMVHLSAQKFVHRDLAARNILLGNDNVAKVSDFGLARDIECGEEYIRTTQNLLPVKWMAVESLLHGRFTTASDVWSFGVLLYEIATLGEEPYKNISPYNIINHVGSGCRMPKPAHCSNEIYEIMCNCWKVKAEDRPTFPEIWQDLQDMLTDNEKSYINVEQVKDEESETADEDESDVMIKDTT